MLGNATEINTNTQQFEPLFEPHYHRNTTKNNFAELKWYKYL